MGLVLVQGPAVEAVLLASAKDHLHVDGDDELALISGLIAAGIRHVEERLSRSLINQTWKLTLDQWPACAPVTIVRTPVRSINSITYIDQDGVTQTLAANAWQLDNSRSPARLAPAPGLSWPPLQAGRMNAVTIEFIAGYGPSWNDVPEDIRHAVLMLIAHWHANREAVVTGTISKELEFAVSELLAPHRGMVLA